MPPRSSSRGAAIVISPARSAGTFDRSYLSATSIERLSGGVSESLLRFPWAICIATPDIVARAEEKAAIDVRFKWTVIPALAVSGFISGVATLLFVWHPGGNDSDLTFFVVGSCAFAFGVSSVLVILYSVRIGAAGIIIGATIAAHLFMYCVGIKLTTGAYGTYGLLNDDVVFGTMLLTALPLLAAVLLTTSTKKPVWVLLVAPICASGAALATAFVHHTQRGVFISFLLGAPLFVTWQVNLALFLGIALWLHGNLGAEIRTVPLATPSVPQASRGTMFSVLVLFVILLGIWDVHEDSKEGARMRNIQQSIQVGIAKSLSEAPASVDLPPVETRPVNEVLIMDSIGDSRPFNSSSSPLAKPASARAMLAGVNEAYIQCPAQLVTYFVSYSNPGSEYQANVTVTEYPNPDWAKYEVRNTPMPNEAIDHPESVQSLIKFGNRVDQVGPYYFWSSGNRLIFLDCPQSQPVADQLVFAYLEKYPSSL